MKPGHIGFRRRPWAPQACDLLRLVCEVRGVSQASLQSTARTRPLAEARRVAWLVLRVLDYSYPEIGAITGGADHSTVLTAIRKSTAENVEQAERILDRLHEMGSAIIPGCEGRGSAQELAAILRAPSTPESPRMRLFREHVERWRQLCENDVGSPAFEAARMVVAEHFERLREIAKAREAGAQ